MEFFLCQVFRAKQKFHGVRPTTTRATKGLQLHNQKISNPTPYFRFWELELPFESWDESKEKKSLLIPKLLLHFHSSAPPQLFPWRKLWCILACMQNGLFPWRKVWCILACKKWVSSARVLELTFGVAGQLQNLHICLNSGIRNEEEVVVFWHPIDRWFSSPKIAFKKKKFN